MKWATHDWRSMLDCNQWVATKDREQLGDLLRGRTVWLASTSPRRREILAHCGIRHHVLSQSLIEPLPHGPDWRSWVRTWATRKAERAVVGAGLRPARLRESGTIVIAADTIVVFKSHGLGKPRDRQDASSMLRSLSAQIHQVYTGVAVINVSTARKAAGSAVSYVQFRRLSDAAIARYARSGEPMDKAGAYAIQGAGGQFVDQIAGPLDNIIGLPVACLARLLQRVLR